MSAERPVLCVVGDLVEDVVVWPERAVVVGTDNPCVVRRTRGGSAANVAAMAGPHVATRFVGCVGDDPAGAALEQQLASTGVDVRLERRDRTGSVIVIVDPTGERTMFPDRAAAAQLSPAAVAWAEDVDLLHISAYVFAGGPTLDVAMAMAAVVRANGGRVTIDASAASLISDLGVSRFLTLVARSGAGLLFANRDEAAALGVATGAGLPSALSADERALGAHLPGGLTVVVKDGPRPVRVLVPGQPTVEVPAPLVTDVRDTTGAGDAFAAGTLAAWLHGADLPAACLAGHRLAAQVLATPGAGGQGPALPRLDVEVDGEARRSTTVELAKEHS